MADTLGSLIDKLFTTDTKMWTNQDLLYEIRRMSFEDYKTKYFASELGAQELWACLQKSCDLNVQRNQLIDEIDKKIVEMVKASSEGQDLDNGSFIQRKHKTY
jgi:hypothetical protein